GAAQSDAMQHTLVRPGSRLGGKGLGLLQAVVVAHTLEAPWYQGREDGCSLGIGFAVMSGGPEAHLESGDDVAESSRLITGSAKAAAHACQRCRKPLQGSGELAQQRHVGL